MSFSSGRQLALLCVLLQWPAPSSGLEVTEPAVEYTQVSWTEKDGLPSNNIWSIAQDKDGFVWLGTTAGLVRFDGARFVVWAPRDRSPVPPVQIPALFTANDGSLWVAYGEGPSRVARIQNDRVVDYTSREGLHTGTVYVLTQGRDGTVWAGGRGGVSRFRNNVWERLGGRLGHPEPTVEALFEDRAGRMWIGTSSGVFRGSASASSSDTFQLISPAVVRGFSEDAHGVIWVTDPRTGATQLDRPGPLAGRIATWGPLNGIRLLRSRDGTLWVGTVGQGLIRISQGTEDPPRVERTTVHDGLAGDVVRSLLEDRDGGIWIGTLNGLTRLSKAKIISAAGRTRSAIDPVGAITAAKDGSVWAGTGDGLTRFSRVTGDSHTYRDSLSRSVTALHSDADGNVWVGSDQGLTRSQDGRLVPVEFPRHLMLKRIWAISTDAEGALWVSDYHRGVFRWKGGTLTPVVDVPSGIVRCIYTDSRGRVWLGFFEGAVAVYEHGRFRSYSDELAGGPVIGIHEDTRGAVWVATSGGLSKFDSQGPTTVTQRRGLPGNRVIAFILDRNDQLWFAVNTGIVRLAQREFDRAVADESYRMQYRLYDASDGLRGTPMQPGYPNVTRGNDGALWFVTTSGLSVLHPEILNDDRPPPLVHLDEVFADGRKLEGAPPFVLPSGTSRLQVDYTALAFGGQAQVQFRYMLDGFDRHWVENGASRRAMYTNLPPGRYRLRVSARYNDGVWGEPGATSQLVVEPLIYQTRWFYVACIVIAAMALGSMWQVRLRQVKKHFALVIAERTRLGREIHDTLLQSLVGTALQLDNLSGKLDDSQASLKQQLLRVRRQVQYYIQETNQSIWDLRSPVVQEKDLPGAIREAAEIIIERTGIHLECSVHGSPRGCPETVQRQLLLIAREAVSNAARHAGPQRIRLELSYDDGWLRLHISDNGRGFDLEAPAESHRTRWGLTIMSERARQIGGRLSIASSVSVGTTIEAIVPLPTPIRKAEFHA